MPVITKVNAPITVSQLRELYEVSDFVREKLRDSDSRLQTMLDHTQLIISLWDGSKLIGLARCLTDYEVSCYLSEIVVSPEYRGQGLGQRLMRAIRNCLDDRVTLVLRAEHSAIGFYERIGLHQIDNLYRIHRKEGDHD